MPDDLWLQRRLIELKIGFIFLTRLPVVHNEPMAQGDLSRALWTAPVVGFAVALVGAAVYAVAHALHVPPLPAAALVAAHAAGRAGIPAFMQLVPPARADGLSADAGTPPGSSSLAAALLGAVALIACLGWGAGLLALLLLAAAFAFMSWLCRRQIHGQTGDVLGALEQAGEAIVLLVASAALHGLR